MGDGGGGIGDAGADRSFEAFGYNFSLDYGATQLGANYLAMDTADGTLRVAFAVVGGAIVLAVGAWRRWQALVVVGAVTCGLVGFTQLAPVVARMPNSVVIGAVGITLLALGVRYEQRRANARQAASWLASMT